MKKKTNKQNKTEQNFTTNSITNHVSVITTALGKCKVIILLLSCI